MADTQYTLSPNQKAIKRLLKNKPAVFGMIVILFAVVVAFLGYSITPDSTPNANDQINEIAIKPTGFRMQLLKVRKNQDFPSQNIFTTMFYGKPNPYKLIPIESYAFKKDSIVVEQYKGDNIPAETAKYSLADVRHPLSFKNPNVQFDGQEISLSDIKGNRITNNIEDLKKYIEAKQIYTAVYPLGTDKFGRCILSRLTIGVRISLMVGFIAVLISLTIGIFMGAIAGYFGGRFDDFVMLIINTIWSIPTLLLVFALVIALGRGFWQIFVAVGLTMWVDVARIVRGQVLSLREIQFVEAAQSMGFSSFRIIVRHILPNILGPVMVIAAANFATAILVEAGLSYLGFGIQPPQPSWGTMLSDNYGYLFFGNNPMLAIAPGIAIMLMVLAFNLIGNGFRDALDVKTKLGGK